MSQNNCEHKNLKTTLCVILFLFLLLLTTTRMVCADLYGPTIIPLEKNVQTIPLLHESTIVSRTCDCDIVTTNKSLLISCQQLASCQVTLKTNDDPIIFYPILLVVYNRAHTEKIPNTFNFLPLIIAVATIVVGVLLYKKIKT